MNTSFLTVQIDTQGSQVNAIEGVVHLPASVLATHIEDGRSSVVVWIKRPAFDPVTKTISFSGITPGGFQGSYPLFSFSNATTSDISKISFSNVAVLQNDGLGTLAHAKLSVVAGQAVEDHISPEAFVPLISTSKELFNGAYFVSFNTSDKQSGIDHYEFGLSRFTTPHSWTRTESPLVLEQNALSERIYLKAVDRTGNYTISSVAGPKYYNGFVLWGILIVLLVCALSYSRRFFR